MVSIPPRRQVLLLAALIPVCAAAQLAPRPIPDTPDPSLEHQRQQQRAALLRRGLEQAADVHRPAAPAPDITRLPADEQPCFVIHRVALDGDAGAFRGLEDALEGRDGRDPPQGRCLGKTAVELLARRTQNALLIDGYVTSRVAVPAQDLATGTLHLVVHAGTVDHLRFADDGGPQTSLATAMPIARGQLLQLRDIEQGLENLKRLASAEADIEIHPGQAVGASDLVVHYRTRSPWHVTLTADDGGRKATGRYQGGVTVAYDNPLGANDFAYLALSHDLMADGARRGTWGALGHYSIPYGYWNLALTLGRNRDRQSVQGATTRYVYGGFSTSAELELSRIVHRDAAGKSWLGAGAWRRTARNDIDGTEVIVQRRQTAGWLASAGHRRFVGNAVIDASVDYRHGTGAFGAIAAPEEAFGEATSRIRKTVAEIRLDTPIETGGLRLGYSGALRAQWNHSRLNPQELFVIGGRYTVRGFDGESVLAGERGWWLRNELSSPLPLPAARAYVGIDHGRVAGSTADRLVGRQLTGAVLGVRGHHRHAGYEFFVGAPIDKPSGFEASGTTPAFACPSRCSPIRPPRALRPTRLALESGTSIVAGGTGVLGVDRGLNHGIGVRALAAHRARFVAGDAHLMPVHRLGVEQHQLAVERTVLAEQEADRFGRLQGSDDADQRCEHAHHRAAFAVVGPGRREQAVVARPSLLAAVEHRHLARKANAGTADQRSSQLDAGRVDGVSGREIVAAIDDDVGSSDQGRELLRTDPASDRLDLAVGIDLGDRPTRRFGLVDADRRLAVDDLALQIGQVHLVAIAHGQPADAGRGHVQGGRRPESAGTDHQHVAVEQALLALDVNRRQHDVAAVADQLSIVHQQRPPKN